MKVLGVIPARYGSSRLRGKPLAMIGSRSMIRMTYESVQKCSRLDEVVVATDHVDIIKEVQSFGGKAVMTSENHQSGTDRCAEVLKNYSEGFTHVINIQGDEPLIPAEMIDQIVGLLDDNSTDIATLASLISDYKDLFNENKVKVVLDNQKRALYFSRAAIPHQKELDPEIWAAETNYYRHIGIYGFKVNTLKSITALEHGVLEKVESLEQLRWLENGYSIQVGITDLLSPSVDTAEDLNRIRKHLLG